MSRRRWQAHSSLAVAITQLPGYAITAFSISFLVRRISAEGLGQVVFIQSVAALVSVVAAFGFDVGMTTRLATEPLGTLGVITSSAWVIQWAVLAALAPPLLVFSHLVPSLLSPTESALALGLAASSTIFPNWALVAQRGMSNIAIPYLLIRLTAIPLAMMFATGPTGAYRFVAILEATGIVAGGAATILGVKRGALTLTRPELSVAWHTARSMVPIWTTSLWIASYVLLVPVVIGVAGTRQDIAAYGVASMGRTMLQGIFSPYLTARLPVAARQAKQDPEVLRKALLRSAKSVSAILVPIALLIIILSQTALHLIGGKELIVAREPVRLMAFVPWATAISGLFGTQYVLVLGRTNLYMRTLRSASICTLVLIYPAVRFGGAFGAAALTLVIECFVGVIFVCESIQLVQRRSSRRINNTHQLLEAPQ